MVIGGLTSNVVFALGVVGATKARAQLLAVAGAVAFVGTQLVSVFKDAEKFAMAWGALGQAQKVAVNEADKASKGLIDTFAILQGRAKLAKAGIEVSGKDLTNIVKVAISDGQKLGHTAEEITSDFDKIVSGIAKGQTRVFKEMGKEFKDGALQIDVAREGLEFLAERAETSEVKIRSLSEFGFAVLNQTGTELGTSMSKINEALETNYHLFERLENQLGNIVGVIDSSSQAAWNLALSFEGLSLSALDSLVNVTEWAMGIKPVLLLLEAITNQDYSGAHAAIGMIREAGVAKEAQILRLGASVAGDSGGGPTSFAGMQSDKGPKQEIFGEAHFMEGTIFDSQQGFGDLNKKFKGKKGGGRRREDDLIFTAEEIEQIDEEEALRSAEIAYFGALLDETDQAEMGRRAARKQVIGQGLQEALLDSKTQTMEQVWLLELEQDEKDRVLQQERLDFRNEMMGIEVTRQLTHNEEMLGIEQSSIDQSNQLWESGLSGKMQSSKKFFSAFGKAREADSKAGFKLLKILNAGEIIANTASGAIAAYSSLAGIPIVGPFLGASAAAAISLYGAKRLADLNALKFGQTSASQSAPPSFSSSSPNTFGAESDSGTNQPIINQFVLDGNIIQEQLVMANTRKSNGNEPAFAMAG